MNRPPEILVNTGFPTDQNGVLTELDIPSAVNTLNAPTKVTFLGETINWIPSTAAALLEFNAPNMTQIAVPASTNIFHTYTALTTAIFNNLTSITLTGAESRLFLNCNAITTVVMDKLESIVISSGSWGGVFYGCGGIANLTLPSLVSIVESGGNIGAFRGCTGLRNVQLGSEGHPVTAIASTSFGNCTQSGLTITVYTEGGAALSGSPWGATNATIEYEEA